MKANVREEGTLIAPCRGYWVWRGALPSSRTVLLFLGVGVGPVRAVALFQTMES